ncbi:hypothetical protein AKJ16_DCAP24193 [Drosera capensis]
MKGGTDYQYEKPERASLSVYHPAVCSNFAIVPSQDPYLTHLHHCGCEFVSPKKLLLTISILSLAAKATMSAQETTPLQAASSLAFALSMISNPRRLGLLAGESFSALFEGVESMSTDPSQPCKVQLTVSVINETLGGRVAKIEHVP